MIAATADIRLARAALTALCEPANPKVAVLVADHGPVAALHKLAGSAAPVRCALDQAAEHLGLATVLGGRLVCPEDAEWPSRVDDLAVLGQSGDPAPAPVALWVRGPGDLGQLCTRSVSVVGARAATSYGTHVATELAYGLGDRGWTVVSGGAYGIDGAAHRGALAAGAPTIAVLACGIDRPYPLGHQALFDRIAADGLLVSEWPPGSTPRRLRFLVRNRVIAALSAGTVVVEAASRSGARMTARRAGDLCRPLMAVPGPVTSAMSVGAHQLVRSGAATLVTSAAEILDCVGRIGDDLAEVPRQPATVRDELSPELARVIDGVPGSRARPAEEVAAAAGVGLRDVLRALPLLVAVGLVQETPAGFRLTEAGRVPTGLREAAPSVR